MQRRSQLGFVLGVLLALSGTAFGQTVNGSITGVVKDSSGGVVPDVALTLRNIATDQIVGTTVSGPEGEYAFRNLPPSKYEVQATKEGFQQVSMPDIEVTLGSTSARRSDAAGRRAGAARRGPRRVVDARHDRRRRSMASRPRRCSSCRC